MPQCYLLVGDCFKTLALLDQWATNFILKLFDNFINTRSYCKTSKSQEASQSSIENGKWKIHFISMEEIRYLLLLILHLLWKNLAFI